MVRWFNNLRLQSKFMLVFALISILGTVSTGWYIAQINEISSYHDLTVENARKLANVREIQQYVQAERTALEEYLRTGDTIAVGRMSELQLQAWIAATLVEEESIDETFAEDASALNLMMGDLYGAGLDIFNAHEDGRTNDAESLSEEMLAPGGLLTEAEGELAGFIHRRGLEYDSLAEEVAFIRRSSLTFGVGAIVLIFLLAMFASLVTNSVAQPVLYLTNAVVSFKSGEFNDELLRGYEKRTEEIGQLINAFTSMVDSINESNRNKDLLLNAARRFVPEAYLDFLEKPSITDINLGDHISARMTVMFSDIRGFTTMSEGMSPQENFDFVNTYLQRVTPVIQQFNGFVVKFLGDGMMAIFPYSVEDAIKAGIAKLRATNEISQSLTGGSGKGGINLGVGIHMGEMMVGMIGEEKRMQGDAFSDNVNLTARLEGLNKTFGTNMIISHEALLRLENPGNYLFRPIGKVVVKGRETPLTLYDIFEGDAENVRNIKQETLPLYNRALDLFTYGDFAAALDAFRQITSKNPADGPAAFYVEQCSLMMQSAKPEGWDGVIVMTTK